MNALFRSLMRTGFRKGISGSRGWLMVGISLGTVRVLRRLAHDKPEVLYRTRVRAGDRFVVASRPRQ